MRILRFYIEYISIVQYKVINYSHHLIHEIHRPYWSYNWKSVFTLISQFPFFPPAIPWQSLFYSISRNSKQIFRSYTQHVIPCRICLFLWLISLTNVLQAHLCGHKGQDFSLLKAEQYFIVYIHHIFLSHSSIGGHLVCFRTLVIVNSCFRELRNADISVVEWLYFFWK